LLIVVVDDLLIAFDRKYLSLYEEFLRSFKEFTEVKELTPDSYVGFEIIRDRSHNQLTIRQHLAIENVLREHRFADCKPESAPAVKNLQLSIRDCPADGSKEQEEMKQYPYRSIVGSLLFVSVMTRPDITYIVNSLARFSTNPGKPHWNALRHLLRYLRGTSKLGLVLGGQVPKGKPLLEAYADASWADNVDDRHSTSGYCFTLFGSLIAWFSRNQYLLARSSFEAELISLYGATAEFSWIRNLLKDFNIVITTTPFYVDNKTTIDQVKEHVVTKRTRHIDIRFYSTSEYYQGGLIDLVKIDTADNLSDIFTKAVDVLLLLKHRSKVLTG